MTGPQLRALTVGMTAGSEVVFMLGDTKLEVVGKRIGGKVMEREGKTEILELPSLTILLRDPTKDPEPCEGEDAS